MKSTILVCLGNLIALSLFAQVDNIGTKDFSIVQNGVTLKIPYESSHEIETANPELKYLVLSMHGAQQNADDYYDRTIAAQNLAGEDGDSTLVIAPQFLTETDIDAFSLNSDYLYWSSGGWISGSNSRDEDSNPRAERIPSYEVLDSLIVRVKEAIPTIKFITLVGHSAGAQLVHRMALSSPLAIEQSLDARLRFIVANPSSYVYLDNKRRVAGTVDQFQVPAGTSCNGFNEWKFGLEDRFTYPQRQGSTAMRNSYKDVEVIYLAGGADNDPNSSSLDTGCEANLQGDHRLERATIYFNYLQDYYNTTVHQLDTVDGVGHSSADMFTSEKGLFHIFKALGSESTTTSIRAYAKSIKDLSVFPIPAHNRITLSSPSTNAQLVRYQVFDLTGRKVLNFNSRDDNQEVDTSLWPSGTYLVQAILANQVYQKKIIVL